MRNNTNLSQSSIDLYCIVINKFFSMGEEPTIDNINRFIAKNFREQRNYYYKFAFRHYLSMHNRIKDYEKLINIKTERGKKVVPIYLPKHILLDIIKGINNPKSKLVAEIQMVTGCRANEILKLRWSDIQPDKSLYIRQEKTHDSRTVSITNKLSRDLDFLKPKNIKSDAYIFWNPAIKLRSLYWKYLNHLRKASLSVLSRRFRTHDFRRNYVNTVLKHYAGDPRALERTQIAVGHKNLKTTMKYLPEISVDKKELVRDLYED